ncbi:MAG: metal-dependent hydrolase [candidate division NC10 bacterium]|jgi:membrane-bound metal-dependent hydrolase YbcI (DUF457 family)|nr:metal-dependent hydrolase [candidate division NC10 bacterium]MCH7896067.1 metal-dependent hydrolase [candidate division NC10 bacterium]MCZ6550391.1 metal-dependent hydrolase [candidate division NC10 bacterium]
MDALTHTCSGILIGQALRPLSMVRRQTLVVLGLAALAPDVDVISYLWGPELYSRLHHAYTHTIIGVAVLAVMLAGIERTWVRGIGFARLVILNLAGCSVHLLGDLIALWPLRLLWPWSGHDFALRWTGDFDLVVLVVVGLATGLAATDGLQHRARWILGAVLLILAGYFWWFPGAAGLQ